MNHSDAAIAALYDHEEETAREREHSAYDWGGDELFSGSPRRRFHHRSREGVEWRRPALAAPGHRERAGAASAQLDVAAPSAQERAERLAALEALDRPELDDGFERAPSGRRTVTVTGHPDRRGERSLAAGPRRPSRTVDQRLAHRPDRVASLAFGLGMLLILVAILTAHA